MTKKTAPIDPASPRIIDDEFVDAPRIASSKYDAIFANLGLAPLESLTN